MKHLKLFEDISVEKTPIMKSFAKKNGLKYVDITQKYDFVLSSFISVDIVTKLFAKYGLACDNDNQVVDDEDLELHCMFSSYAMDGSIPKNINQILEDICEEVGADDWWFGIHTGTVVFSFDEDKFKTIDKYNL